MSYDSNTTYSSNSSINSIAHAMGGINQAQKALENVPEDDPEALLAASMDLMKATQRFDIMSESFTKTMKALHDANKAAIQNMH